MISPDDTQPCAPPTEAIIAALLDEDELDPCELETLPNPCKLEALSDETLYLRPLSIEHIAA